MNVILIGPQLVLRALDDLHAIAEAARDLPSRIGVLEDRLEDIEGQARTAIEVAQAINTTAATAMVVAEQVDERLETVLELGERIETRAGEVLDLGGTLQELALQVLDEARIMAVRAEAVAEVGGQVVASLPALERAVTMATPLEGAVERVGRLVDRLPGGRPPEPRDSGA